MSSNKYKILQSQRKLDTIKMFAKYEANREVYIQIINKFLHRSHWVKEECLSEIEFLSLSLMYLQQLSMAAVILWLRSPKSVT